MQLVPRPQDRPARAERGASGRRGLGALAATLGLALAAPAQALEFGPFSLTGFAKVEATRQSPACTDNACQVDPGARKDFVWADELKQGRVYGPDTTHVTLLQPYLQAKFPLPRGYRLSALVSQRWRDGKADIPGFWYDRSIALEHEDYGSIRLGAMTTRGWSMADYPFGSDIGLADSWGSSGAGYGLLTRALRATSRPFDVAEGDLVVEGTYDIGKPGWHRNDPRFLELWVHYGRGDLSLDFIAQDARNGTPGSFAHGPFSALFYDNRFDEALGGSSQGMAMLMARYRLDARFELLGGVRANRWSGAYAKLLQGRAQNPAGYDVWNNPFNVDWSTDLGGGVYKGYPARSVDIVVGGRWQKERWTYSAGLLHLGAASTDNPTDRGARNAATIATGGVSYDVGQGLRVYGMAGVVQYARKGLSPLSMPGNASFTGIDSRLKSRGGWFGAGAVYTF